MTKLLVEIDDHVGTVTFNDDAKRNALSRALIDELIATLDQLRERVRAVVLRANPGAKVWSAGHDFRELPEKGADPLAYQDRLVSAAELENVTYDLARAIAANSPLSISVVKEQMRSLCNAHALSPETFERLQSLRQAVFDSHDYEEGIRAIRDKRQPVFTGQ